MCSQCSCIKIFFVLKYLANNKCLRSLYQMPNIKSAKKRVLVNTKKTEENKAIRSELKTEIKKLEVLIKENKVEEAKAALPCVFSVIDSACSKNIIHANNAANKKAKLSKKLDSIAKNA